MEHRTEPSPRDISRLQKGDEALALGEPLSWEEAREQLEILRDAVIALQSIGDLGTSAANELASRNLVAVQAKYDRLRENLRLQGLGYTLGRHRS